MNTRILLLTDTHFGCKGGSHTWFKYQSRFIYNQFIPKIRELKAEGAEVIVIHLGDVFDSRSTLNTMIGMEVRAMFKTVAAEADMTYIIPGNHDYFSEQSDQYCTPALVLGNIERLVVSAEHDLCVNVPGRKLALVPWPVQKTLSPADMSNIYKGHTVLTHADIITGFPRYDIPVFSGHIHTPYIKGNTRNLGSCFAIDFHDHNQDRYFYVWDPGTDHLEHIANTHSIRFWRWHDEGIKNADHDRMGPDDYIELYISSKLMQQREYQDIITGFKKNFKNVWIIPTPEPMESSSVDVTCDMESIIEQAIPEDLKELFEQLKTTVNEYS